MRGRGAKSLSVSAEGQGRKRGCPLRVGAGGRDLMLRLWDPLPAPPHPHPQLRLEHSKANISKLVRERERERERERPEAVCWGPALERRSQTAGRDPGHEGASGEGTLPGQDLRPSDGARVTQSSLPCPHAPLLPPARHVGPGRTAPGWRPAPGLRPDRPCPSLLPSAGPGLADDFSGFQGAASFPFRPAVPGPPEGLCSQVVARPCRRLLA